MTDITVRLPDGAQSFVEAQVASGQFSSASEFLVSLVQQAQRQAAAQRVDELLVEGLESGPGEEATPEWWAKTREDWRQKRRGVSRS